jgi:hypothetical protein
VRRKTKKHLSYPDPERRALAYERLQARRKECQENWGVDLGVALLSVYAKPGVPLTYDDIAVWAGCTSANIYLIERPSLRKLREAILFRDRNLAKELEEELRG